MSSDDCSKDMADKQSDNSRPQGENDPPQKPDESDPARAKKEAILDHILRTLTTRPWCTSTSKDERLSNLSVYFEFKQLLEDDKAILERIDAKKATTEGKLKTQIDTLKERLKTKDAKAAENSTKFRNFEAKAAEKDRDLESKANENSVLNVKIRTLEAEVAKKDEEAEELRRDKSRLQDCANELKKGNACLKEQVQQLKSSAEAAKQRDQAAQQLRREKGQLQDRVDEVTKENASLAEQIQQLKSSAEITGFQKTLVSKHKANQRDNSTVDKPNHDDRASTSAVPETQDQPTDLSKAEFERRLTHTTSIRLKGRDLLATLQADAQVLIWLRGGGANIVYSGTDDDDVDQAATALRRVMWDGDEARVERKDGKPIIEYNFGQPVGDKEMLKLLRKIT